MHDDPTITGATGSFMRFAETLGANMIASVGRWPADPQCRACGGTGTAPGQIMRACGCTHTSPDERARLRAKQRQEKKHARQLERKRRRRQRR